MRSMMRSMTKVAAVGSVADAVQNRMPSKRRSKRPMRIGTVGTFTGAVGAGCAAMFMLDPQQGRRRRALAFDKIRKYRRKTRETAGGTTVDIRNRAEGKLAAVRNLKARAEKGELGMLVLDAVGKVARGVDINVETTAGRVTLSGKVPRAVVEKIRHAVARVPGVEHVDDRIEVIEDSRSLSTAGRGNRSHK